MRNSAALSPPQTAHLHKQHSCPQRTTSLDPRPSSLRPSTDRLFTDVCCQPRTRRGAGAPHQGLSAGRGLSLVDGQPQAWSDSDSTEVRPTKEAPARPTGPARLARRPRPRPPRPHRATHTGLRRRQPGLLHVLRPRRPIPTASCFPAPAARPPQPRPPADAPPIGLRAGPPVGRLRARLPALIGGHTGKGGAGGDPSVQGKAVQLLRGWIRAPHAGRTFGAGRGLGTRELCTGWDLGKPRVLSLWLAGRIRSWTRLRNYGNSGLSWTLERGWALREPWAGLWHRGGSQPTGWL